MARNTAEITGGTVVSTGSWSGFTSANLNNRSGANASTNALTFTEGTLSNFDFALPAGAVPVGLEVITNISSSNAGATASIRVRISKDAGSNWSAYSTTVTSKSTSYADFIHGANNSLWGLSLSAAEINDTTNFYVSIDGQTTATNRTCRLQYVGVVVYYSLNDTLTAEVSSVEVVGSAMTPSINYNRTLADSLTLSDSLTNEKFGVFRVIPLAGSTALKRVGATLVPTSVDAEVSVVESLASIGVTRTDSDLLPTQVQGYVETLSLTASIGVKRLSAINDVQKLEA